MCKTLKRIPEFKTNTLSTRLLFYLMQRKKPFSHKQKKQQLKEKRRQQQSSSSDEEGNTAISGGNTKKGFSFEPVEFVKASTSSASKGEEDTFDKLVSVFERESEETIRKRKEEAMQPLVPLSLEKGLEVSYESVYPQDVKLRLEIPKRPPWTSRMSRDQLESNEKRYFNSKPAEASLISSKVLRLVAENRGRGRNGAKRTGSERFIFRA